MNPLILGCGDGGPLHELLKESLKFVTMVEIALSCETLSSRFSNSVFRLSRLTTTVPQSPKCLQSTRIFPKLKFGLLHLLAGNWRQLRKRSQRVREGILKQLLIKVNFSGHTVFFPYFMEVCLFNVISKGSLTLCPQNVFVCAASLSRGL